jgi:hypothetical protein
VKPPAPAAEVRREGQTAAETDAIQALGLCPKCKSAKRDIIGSRTFPGGHLRIGNVVYRGTVIRRSVCLDCKTSFRSLELMRK